MGLLTRGTGFLLSRLLSGEGATVEYSRGADSISIQAVKGKAEITIESVSTISIEDVDASFIFDVADMLFDAVPVEPTRGDRIEEATGEIWEVTPFGSLGCYRKSGDLVRVFVKRVPTS